jgi:hypothetical protein
MTSRTPRTYMAYRARICRMVDLPFWRATSRTTVRNRGVPSGRTSRAWIRSHFCHGSRVIPTTSSANRMQWNPPDVFSVSGLSGGVKIRGTSTPRSG